MNALREWYYYFFYALFRMDLFHHSDSFNEWRAYASVTLLECIIIGMLDLWVMLLTGRPFVLDLPGWLILLLSLGLAGANYQVFLHGSRWRSYAGRFSQYSSIRRRVSTGIAVLVILLAVALVGVTLYEVAARASAVSGPRL